MEIYGRRLIEYNWYLGIQRDGSGCRVQLHDRKHYGDAGQPETLGSFRMQEDDKRTVHHVLLTHNDGREELLVVSNPGHVFSYPRFVREA